MLLPRKVKHRKWQKRTSRRPETRGTSVAFGAYGLKALQEHWVSSRQIEAARRAMTRFVEKSGKIWIRIFPDKPVTRKGAEVPMGGGKGAPDHFVFPVRPGRMLFEIDGIAEEVAREAFRRAGHKLPLKTRFVKRT